MLEKLKIKILHIEGKWYAFGAIVDLLLERCAWNLVYKLLAPFGTPGRNFGGISSKTNESFEFYELIKCQNFKQR